jgi:NAD(P)H-hydrate epimerase
MIPVLTAADVKSQDEAASERGIAVDALMRAAGTAVAHAAIELLGGAYGARIVVVCGKGNNGGDGLVAARALARRGARVTASLPLGPANEGAAARALAAYGGDVVALDALPNVLAGADLAIDAIFGVGLTRAPAGEALRAVEALDAAPCPVLAVDVPSGVDADRGRIPGAAVDALVTVTFGGHKPGLLFAPGAGRAGDVLVRDIGMPDDLVDATAWALEGRDVAALLPRREPDANKYRSGVAMLVCGSRTMPGAAVLASAACARSGAGLVMLAAQPDVCALAVERSPEIVTVPLPESPEGVLDEKGLEAIRERIGRAGALAVGPGLTRHLATAVAVRELVAEAQAPLVLDADGLNAFEHDREALAARAYPTVLTPHEGEYARLAGKPVDDRLRDAVDLADRTGAVVLLKGAGTVIASPDGRLAVNTTGGSNLASAGTGDVLTGIIAALLARGLEPFYAAACAAFLHGAAADSVARDTLRAGDVLDALPPIFEALEDV